MDTPAIGTDTFANSSHKWSCGPKECGGLAVRAQVIPRLWPSGVAAGSSGDANPDPTGARKFKAMGQRDDACLAAMGTTPEFHTEIGPDRVEKRMIDLARHLKEGVREAGIPLVTPMGSALAAGVVITEVPAESRADVFSRMYDDHEIAGSTSGGFPPSPHLYNTAEHMKRVLAGLKVLRPPIVARARRPDGKGPPTSGRHRPPSAGEVAYVRLASKRVKRDVVRE